MIQKLAVYVSTSTNPYENLAVEEYLTFHTEPDECILYLWQNAHTVVIGRNQNCWKECKVAELEASGGHLVRRLSGGGAVYHDMGNLNFTFCMKKDEADVGRQLQVIAEAVSLFGLHAERTGRNDVAIDGRKFSGNAFFDSQGSYYHHGTLLLHVDTASMSLYLNPSREKLESKGVDSVRSRVVNLADLCPDITVDPMKNAMIHAFSKVYGLNVTPFQESRFDLDELKRMKERFDSWEWKYGQKIPFTNRLGKRFSWGEAELALKVNQGLIEEALLSSDSMEADWFDGIGPQFCGCPYESQAICEILQNELTQRHVPSTVQEELCKMIQEQL